MGGMALTRDTMLSRMLAADSAYDGRFITGVLSTGIYCLPSCRAKKPRPENVVFHSTPAQARAAGLRPCLRCRPDEFYRGHHAGEALAEALAALALERPGEFRDVGAFALAGGVSQSRLHDLFRTHHHATPADFLARSRVRTAQRALLTSRRPITEIAFEVGFESLSAFGHNFRRYSAVTPGALRGWTGTRSLELALPRTYPHGSVLRFLGRDPSSLTDRVADQSFTTILRLGEASACVRVTLEAGTARCTVLSPEELSVGQRLELHGRLLGLLGLHLDPGRFEAQLSRDPALRPLVESQRGLRLPLLPDPFNALVWAILGQQVTLAFACTLRRRLVERWGEPVEEGLWLPPLPETLAGLDMADLLPLGLTRARAATLIAAAQAVASGVLPRDPRPGLSAPRLERLLLSIPGVGPWTAQYVLMRGYGFADCVPVGDSGLSAGLRDFFALEARPSPAETARLMEPFAPHRSLATFHLWQRLNLTPTQETP